MSSPEQAVAALLAKVAFGADGAVIGVVIAVVAVRSIIRFTTASRALRRITKAPSLSISDLRTLAASDQESSSSSSAEADSPDSKFVVVRGLVEAKSSVDGSWMSFLPNVLVSQASGERGVILQKSQKCIYNEWRGFFAWTYDLRSLISRACRDRESTSLRMVPFVLVEGDDRTLTDYVVVNMDGSRHPLPLTTIHHQLHPINPTPYTLLQAFFGYQYPVGILDEEKVLHLGKEITAVGTWTQKNCIPEISSYRDIPYFLSEMSKEEMVAVLDFKAKMFLWIGIFLGSLSVGILARACTRTWKRWREQRRIQAQRRRNAAASSSSVAVDHDGEGTRDVPEGSLCIICLMRRKEAVFTPCGHVACCYACALRVQRDVNSKCPLCRQLIDSSVRIFYS